MQCSPHSTFICGWGSITATYKLEQTLLSLLLMFYGHKESAPHAQAVYVSTYHSPAMSIASTWLPCGLYHIEHGRPIALGHRGRVKLLSRLYHEGLLCTQPVFTAHVCIALKYPDLWRSILEKAIHNACVVYITFLFVAISRWIVCVWGGGGGDWFTRDWLGKGGGWLNVLSGLSPTTKSRELLHLRQRNFGITDLVCTNSPAAPASSATEKMYVHAKVAE